MSRIDNSIVYAAGFEKPAEQVLNNRGFWYNRRCKRMVKVIFVECPNTNAPQWIPVRINEEILHHAGARRITISVDPEKAVVSP